MKKKNLFVLLSGTLFLTLVFIFPYLSNDLSLEHDTLFHLSRIEGLAQSFKSGKLFPDIYPLKNDGFGYASALFYCDLFLVPAALLYLAGFEVAIGYKVTIFLFTWLSGMSMALLLKKLRQNNLVCLFGSLLYLFCNYRITDVYVRGALGEVIAMAFIPLILCGFVDLFLEDEPHIKILILGFAGVALSHNLTLLLCGIGFAVLMVIYWKQMTFVRMKKLIQAAVITIGLCAWFLFPMLEQTSFQSYYLHYYASSSDLKSHALMGWQYLINETIFGISGNQYAYEQIMVVTPGLALLFLPGLFLFDISKKDRYIRFAMVCALTGYFFALLCSDIVPWDKLTLLRIMQFPWRWMTLSCVLLAVGASIGCARTFQNQHKVMIILFVLVLCNSAYLLLPVLDRTLVIHNDTTYAELLNGSIINPYYGNTSYNRIEVAGADYLPQGFLDYRNASYCVTDLDGNELTCTIEKTDSLSFSAPENTNILVPLTAYKGYHVYSSDQEIKWTTVSGRISFNTAEYTDFIVVYEKTPLQLFSLALSCTVILVFILQRKFTNRSE